MGEFKITPEKLNEFREALRKEMLSPGCWYHPSNSRNRDVYVFDHPECPYKITKKGTVTEHRYVWWINNPNDKIEYNEMIRHINGDPRDNRIENLEKVKMKQRNDRHKELRKLKEGG